jgi:hypothetical protein
MPPANSPTTAPVPAPTAAPPPTRSPGVLPHAASVSARPQVRTIFCIEVLRFSLKWLCRSFGTDYRYGNAKLGLAFPPLAPGTASMRPEKSSQKAAQPGRNRLSDDVLTEIMDNHGLPLERADALRRRGIGAQILLESDLLLAVEPSFDVVL